MIYLPIQSSEFEEVISHVLPLASQLNIATSSDEVLHLSLTRPNLPPPYLFNTLKAELSKAASHFASFDISFSSNILVLPNDDGSKLFLGLEASCPTLYPLLSEIDSIQSKYRFEKFYSPPLFHTSFAYISVSSEDSIVKLKEDIELLLSKNYQPKLTKIIVHVDKLCLRMGSKTATFALSM